MSRKPPANFAPGEIGLTCAGTPVVVERRTSGGADEYTVRSVVDGRLISLRAVHLSPLPGLTVLQVRDDEPEDDAHSEHGDAPSPGGAS
jgi:hypothetical protein